MMPVAAILLALLSPFVFPWPFALVLVGVVALFFPLAGLAAGALTDLLYFTPAAAHLPYATLAGLVFCGAGLLVRRFVKARIMGS